MSLLHQFSGLKSSLPKFLYAEGVVFQSPGLRGFASYPGSTGLRVPLTPKAEGVTPICMYVLVASADYMGATPSG